MSKMALLRKSEKSDTIMKKEWLRNKFSDTSKEWMKESEKRIGK